MNTKHTPGPWTVTGQETSRHDATIRAICEEPGKRYELWIADASKHNARLIAAAPELLELLTDVGQWLEVALAKGQISRGTANRDGDLVTQIRAVIAKAKGQL